MKYIICDVDDTLYPPEVGLWPKVSQRINEYMELRLGMSRAEVSNLRREYSQRYGTTTRGLYLHHHLDPEDYILYVHDVPVEEHIQPNPALEAMLSRLEVGKAIFTNGSEAYARRILRALGVEGHFPFIFDLRFMQFRSKPDPEPYRWMLQALDAKGKECLLVDDAVRNLLPGKELGMRTALVGDSGAEGIDYAIADLLQLESIVQGLR